jgi:hypothetical protein
MSAIGVRRDKGRFPVGASPTRQTLQPEAIGAVMEVTKLLKPSIDVSRDQRFFDPIELPGGHKLVTLREAALYITKLPKAEHDAEEWLAAMEALLLRWPNRAAGALSQAAQNPLVEWNEGAAFVMRHAAYGGVC